MHAESVCIFIVSANGIHAFPAVMQDCTEAAGLR